MTTPSESTERVQTPLEVVSDEIYDAVAALDKDFAKHLYTADEGRLKLHALVFGYYRRGLDDGDNGLYGKDELAQEYSRGATKELDWVLAATNNPEDPCFAPKIAREVADRIAELEKGQEDGQ